MPIAALILIAAAAVFLAGCASSKTVQVTVEHVDQATVQAIAEGYEKRTIQTRLRGYTTWEESAMGTEGHIAILPPDQFESLEKYHEILGHELDHVLRGDYHAAWE
jgi:hypothetical protein